MTLREALSRVLGQAGSAPVHTELRPAQVVERARRRSAVLLAWRTLAATAATAAVVLGVVITPMVPSWDERPVPMASGTRTAVGETRPPPPTGPETSPRPDPMPGTRGTESAQPADPEPDDATDGPTRQPDDSSSTATGGPRGDETPAGESQETTRSWETAPKRGPGTATAQQPARLTDIRIAPHEGFDRVVFEYSRRGLPAYEVRYGQPEQPGKGQPVDLLGGTSLEVVFTHTTGARGGSYDGPANLTPSLTRLLEVECLGGFENVRTVGVGISGDARAPFRVLTLPGPPRIVIDVAHPAG